jgi:serine/threonine protein kinase
MRRSSLFNCKNDREVSLEDFEILKVIGQGTFGKVFLVKEKLTQ